MDQLEIENTNNNDKWKYKYAAIKWLMRINKNIRLVFLAINVPIVGHTQDIIMENNETNSQTPFFCFKARLTARHYGRIIMTRVCRPSKQKKNPIWTVFAMHVDEFE